MKLFSDTVWRRRALFLLAGFILAAVCGYLNYRWLDLSRGFLRDPGSIFYKKPFPFIMLHRVIHWLPWVAVFTVLVLRLLKGKSIKLGFFILGVILPSLLIVAYSLLDPIVGDWIHDRTFNVELWRNQDDTAQRSMWPPRLCMVDDLLRKHDFKGMSREQVVALIGEPDKTEYFKDWDMVYWLGPERGFIRIDSEWLVLKLDSKDKVSDYRIARD